MPNVLAARGTCRKNRVQLAPFLTSPWILLHLMVHHTGGWMPLISLHAAVNILLVKLWAICLWRQLLQLIHTMWCTRTSFGCLTAIGISSSSTISIWPFSPPSCWPFPCYLWSSRFFPGWSFSTFLWMFNCFLGSKLSAMHIFVDRSNFNPPWGMCQLLDGKKDASSSSFLKVCGAAFRFITFCESLSFCWNFDIIMVQFLLPVTRVCCRT